MSDIREYDLSTFEEYSVVCDRCGINESTRDGNRSLALANATSEGFMKVKGVTQINDEVLCPQCAAKEQEAL